MDCLPPVSNKMGSVTVGLLPLTNDVQHSFYKLFIIIIPNGSVCCEVISRSWLVGCGVGLTLPVKCVISQLYYGFTDLAPE